MDSMNSHTELSVVTAETKARQLGATVTFHRAVAVASNFPTLQSGLRFVDWLLDRGYSVSQEIAADRNIEVSYAAPIATTNIVLLRNQG